MDKDTKKVLKEAQRQGFEIRFTSSGHPMAYLNGEFVAKGAGTGSDSRHGVRNLIGDLRRAGFKWPPKR